MLLSAFAASIHGLAAVIWVGGMFFAHMALRPAVMAMEPPPERLKLWGRVFPRFFAWVWASVILLNLTGFGIVSEYIGGFGGAPIHIHLMAGLGLVMSAIYIFLYFVPYARFRAELAQENWPEAAARQAVIRKIVGTNLILGLITVAIGAGGRYWG